MMVWYFSVYVVEVTDYTVEAHSWGEGWRDATGQVLWASDQHRHQYTYHQFDRHRRHAALLAWTTTDSAGGKTHGIQFSCNAANLSYKCRPVGK